MERTDRPPVATFHAPGEWGGRVELSESAAHHASVKRLGVGDAVRLTSGDGRRAVGTIAELARRRLVIDVDADATERVPPLPALALWAPVGDRERMLLLAEKAAELGVTRWEPVVYRRSRSVTPRGEGEAFRDKVRLRMISALEQSGSAWLPEQGIERSLDQALDAHVGSGVLLDGAGAPLVTLDLRAPVTIALGPEGGLDAEERAAFERAGWRSASLGNNVLRFETAAIAALAVVRAMGR